MPLSNASATALTMSGSRSVDSVAILLALSLFGCASLQTAGSYRCGGDEERSWRKVASPPSAEAMRAIAAANPVWADTRRQDGTQRWFGTSGFVMLCRVKASARGTGSEEWWIFNVGGQRPVLERQDGRLTVS